MESFVEFLRENWKFVAEIGLLLVSFIVLLLKKKIKVKFDVSEVIAKIPGLIEDAECLIGSGHGNEKLKYVLKRAVDLIVENTGLDTAYVLQEYGDHLITYIEAILSTPQKKGDQ